MKDICVITGGGSGMGLAAAKLLGREYKLIITGRTKEKLERTVKELESDGFKAELFVCDVSDRENVKSLAAYAAETGTVKAVVNAAGLSPHMADAAKIFSVNAIGTVNTDEEFTAVMTDGGCILNIASMAGYLIPDDMIPKDLYPLRVKGGDVYRRDDVGHGAAGFDDRILRRQCGVSANIQYGNWDCRMRIGSCDRAVYDRKAIRAQHGLFGI